MTAIPPFPRSSLSVSTEVLTFGQKNQDIPSWGSLAGGRLTNSIRNDQINRLAVIRFNFDFFDLKIVDHDSQNEGDEKCNEAFPSILHSAPVSLYEVFIGCWGLVFEHHDLVPVS